MILGVARIAGETAPLLFTSLNNQFWSNKLSEPTASLPVMIYYSRHLALRRLAPPGLGRRSGAAGLVLIANIAARWVLSRGASVQRG